MLLISFFYHFCIYLYVSYSTCVDVTVLSYSYSLCGCHCEVWMLDVWGELASHKRLFNPPPQFSRLGTQCPALMSCHLYLCMCFVWILWDLWIYVGGGFMYLFIYLWLVCYELQFHAYYIVSMTATYCFTATNSLLLHSSNMPTVARICITSFP